MVFKEDENLIGSSLIQENICARFDDMAFTRKDAQKSLKLMNEAA